MGDENPKVENKQKGKSRWSSQLFEFDMFATKPKKPRYVRPTNRPKDGNSSDTVSKGKILIRKHVEVGSKSPGCSVESKEAMAHDEAHADDKCSLKANETSGENPAGNLESAIVDNIRSENLSENDSGSGSLNVGSLHEGKNDESDRVSKKKRKKITSKVVSEGLKSSASSVSQTAKNKNKRSGEKIAIEQPEKSRKIEIDKKKGAAKGSSVDIPKKSSKPNKASVVPNISSEEHVSKIKSEESLENKGELSNDVAGSASPGRSADREKVMELDETHAEGKGSLKVKRSAKKHADPKISESSRDKRCLPAESIVDDIKCENASEKDRESGSLEAHSLSKNDKSYSVSRKEREKITSKATSKGANKKSGEKIAIARSKETKKIEIDENKVAAGSIYEASLANITQKSLKRDKAMVVSKNSSEKNVTKIKGANNREESIKNKDKFPGNVVGNLVAEKASKKNVSKIKLTNIAGKPDRKKDQKLGNQVAISKKSDQLKKITGKRERKNRISSDSDDPPIYHSFSSDTSDSSKSDNEHIESGGEHIESGGEHIESDSEQIEFEERQIGVTKGKIQKIKSLKERANHLMTNLNETSRLLLRKYHLINKEEQSDLKREFSDNLTQLKEVQLFLKHFEKPIDEIIKDDKADANNLHSISGNSLTKKLQDYLRSQTATGFTVARSISKNSSPKYCVYKPQGKVHSQAINDLNIPRLISSVRVHGDSVGELTSQGANSFNTTRLKSRTSTARHTVSKESKLEMPDLIALDPSQIPDLVALYPSQIPDLIALDPSQVPDLVALDPSHMPDLVALDPSQSPDLHVLVSSQVPDLIALDPLQMPDLIALDSSQVPDLVALDPSHVPDLIALYPSQMPDLVALDTSHVPGLVALEIPDLIPLNPECFELDPSQVPDLVTNSDFVPETENASAADRRASKRVRKKKKILDL